MSEENFNLDSLLEDLDEAVKPSPQYGAQQTVRYMPHPPQAGKSPNQHNPKNRFAVDNSSSDPDRHSPSKNVHQPTFQDIKPTAAYNGAYNNATGSCAFSPTSSSFDENSVDNLLDMIASPPAVMNKKNLTVFPSAEAKILPSSSSSPSYGNKDSPPSRASVGSGFDGVPPRYSPRAPNASPPSGEESSSSPMSSSSATRALPAKNYGNSTSISSIPSTGHQFGSGMQSGTASASNSRPTSLNSTSMYNMTSSSSGGGVGSTNSGAMPLLGGGSSFKAHSTNNASLWSTSEYTSNSGTANSSSVSSGAKVRCSRVVLGGATMTRGHKSSAFSKACCDNLLCMACNFKIHYFPHRQWDNSIDYMFLRNNVPNEGKLSGKLTNSSDSAAYCCQCSWVNVDKSVGERQLTQGAAGDPQWTCAGH